MPATAHASTLRTSDLGFSNQENDKEHWQSVPACGAMPAHHVYTAPIQKSEQDDRAYRVVRLENGLEVVLVHDVGTDKAAASLDVAVGHLSDPNDIPGLAHFCEHLLFMGTEQYPKENEYSEYLAKNSGMSNAYTAASNTNYYFSVSSTAFAGALERFAGFFHSPLFSPSCTLRELNAVDSENKKNLQSDMWRIFQLNKHLTRPGHAWNKFGTGNKATLTQAARTAKAGARVASANTLWEKPSLNSLLSGNSSTMPSPIPSRVASPALSVSSTNSETEADGGMVGRETRRRLIEWWSKEYCASRMSLTLIGKESLDELTQLAATLFSPILNRGQDPTPFIPEHPFGPDERGTIIHVKTIMDFYAFELSFPLPYQAPHWRVKPASFLAHFVGHEGPGSLHAYLKNKGWITMLSAGEQSLGRGFAMFKITIHMTKEGFQNYRQALLACYKYLSLLRTSALPAWFQQEIQTLAAMRFRFAEKQRPDQYATWIAEHVKHPTPRALVLSGPQLTWHWDEQLVRETLAGLVVENGRVVVMSKDHAVVGKTGPWATEPWYGTEYTVGKLENDFVSLARESNDIPELFLPGPNEFIPSNVEVEKTEVSQPLKRPSLIKRTPLTEVWHKQDDQFWVPRAQVMIEARTPASGSSARASVMTRLYADLVKDALSEYAYDAELAGLNYNFGSTLSGLYISLSGYNDKLPLLTQHVLEKIKNLEVNIDRLAVIKEQVKRQWENFFLGQTYQLSDYYGKYLLADRQFTLSEKLAEIEGITVEELREHTKMLLSQFKYLVLVNGNLRKEDAICIASMSEDILSAQPVPESELPQELSRLLPKACNYIWELQVPNPNQVNASISYYCHVGSISDARLRTTFRLMAQIITEPAFNVLRTKEQLGYIVFSSEWQSIESIGLRIIVQSEKDPKYLESRIEAFLVHMRGVFDAMDDAQFEEQKKGLVHKWTEKLKNMNDETMRFWNHVESGYLDFSRREKDAALLEKVTKADVLALFKEFIDPASPNRSKLSIHMRPKNPPARKLSLAAAEAFLVSLRSAGVTVDDEAFSAQTADEPPVAAVKAHWKGVLGDAKADQPEIPVEALLTKLEELALTHPAVGQGAVELSPNSAFITDGAAFRESLALSGPAKPVEDSVLDMPLSKF
ncbi:insulin-degrading enzyme [Phellopilus nigrolimitatus]|nr:insulin-degrading enzyme [Phellopilus nigrolimitatus]